MTRRLLFAALLIAALSVRSDSQATRTTLAWDLDPTHEGSSWEVETASGIVPCDGVQVVGRERRCVASFPRASTQQVRLRGRGLNGAGPWSAPVTVPALAADTAAAQRRAAIAASGAPLAVDAHTASAPGTGSRAWLHRPQMDAPRGVLVFVVRNDGSDQITGVSYGTVRLTRLPMQAIKTTGEPMTATAWFAGTGLPQGPQTITVVASGTAAVVGYAYTIAARRDTEVLVSKAVSSDAAENPSVKLALGGRRGIVIVGGVSGADSPAAVTPLQTWTQQTETAGGRIVGFTYSLDRAASGDVPAGWLQPADDAAAVVVAVTEKPGA